MYAVCVPARGEGNRKHGTHLSVTVTVSPPGGENTLTHATSVDLRTRPAELVVSNSLG